MRRKITVEIRVWRFHQNFKNSYIYILQCTQIKRSIVEIWVFTNMEKPLSLLNWHQWLILQEGHRPSISLMTLSTGSNITDSFFSYISAFGKLSSNVILWLVVPLLPKGCDHAWCMVIIQNYVVWRNKQREKNARAHVDLNCEGFLRFLLKKDMADVKKR